MNDELEHPAPPKPRWLRRTLIVGQVLLGIGLGLGIAEWAFARRADGAFPHVNFYVADPELGVRLQPRAHMRFRLHDNPVSEIHVNSDGYRGEEWGEPEAGEILVVGDSQVFGLGVDDDETFSARLAELTGRPVINAGVPTYGPLEYFAVTEELLEQRGSDTVVYVINFLNDPFELERPNRERHAVWDGWAVRSETAPARVLEFPGRRWLFSRSHLVYAARRWLHSADAEQLDQLEHLDMGLPSEGGWEDLLADGTRSLEHAEQAQSEADAAVLEHRAKLEEIERELDANETAITKALRDEFDRHNRRTAQIARAQPGDIVVDRYSEAARSITVTAEQIRKATKERDEWVQRQLRVGNRVDNSEVRSLLSSNDSLSEEQRTLRAELAADEKLVRMPSVFEAHLAELARVCERRGAELIVVALPIDVQVSASEWAKYGVDDPPDMTPSLALLDDLIASAEAVGARTLNATAALHAAEPGAFLDGDIHMTAKGHAALAEALAPVVTWRPPEDSSFYTIESGDSLSELAERHGCTVEALAEHNRLLSPDFPLPVGSELDLSICGGRE